MGTSSARLLYGNVIATKPYQAKQFLSLVERYDLKPED
jgi:hypothetical protein